MLCIYVIHLCSNVWAYEVEFNNNIRSINKIKEHVLLKVNEISNEALERSKLPEKKDIMKEKNDIASEFEQKFNQYKNKLFSFNQDIVSLYKVQNYINEINILKQEQVNERNKYIQDIDLLREIHKDEYIPAVIACYLEIPIDKEKQRDSLINRYVLHYMVEKYGIERIFSKTNLKNGIIQDFIKSRKFGKLEYDGLRNYAGQELVDWTARKITKYFTVSFFRFKPFFNIPKEEAYETSQEEQITDIIHWDLVSKNSFNALTKEITQKFSYDIQSDLSDIQEYIKSLGDMPKLVESSTKRIQSIVNNFHVIETEFHERMEYFTKNIKRLQGIIKDLLSQMELNPNCSLKEVKQHIKDKKNQKEKHEKNFKYHFVLMDSLPAKGFENAIKRTLEDIFDKMNTMIQQQAMSIEYIVNMGIIQKITESKMTIHPIFTKVYIKPFIDKRNVGVMLSLSVRYEASQSDKKDNQNEKHKEVQNDTTERIREIIEPSRLSDEYTESAMGLNIQMIMIKGNNKSFYLSKSDISKGQFMIFLKDTHSQLNQYIEDRMFLNLIHSYPTNYPMLGVNHKGLKKFINWLCIKSGKTYKVSSEEQNMIAAQFKIYKGNGFRVSLINKQR